jgi:hypothetical protein
MFAGHIGAALIGGRVERRVNVGVLAIAALLLDAVLWLLVLAGWEAASIPSDFARTHQPEFDFPYSHGLAATLVWSLVAGGIVFGWYPRLGRRTRRAAVVVALVVFSHWCLDVLVHRPELPLAGDASAKVGLGLWRRMPLALATEALLVAAGLGVFLPGAALSRAGRVGIAVTTILVLAATVAGATVAPPPPSVTAMAVSSLTTILVVCAALGWLGRGSSSQASTSTVA